MNFIIGSKLPVLEDESTDKVVNTMVSTLRTGNLGDGKIFVLPVTGYPVGVRLEPF